MMLSRTHICLLLFLLLFPACTSTDSVYDLDQDVSKNWDHRVRERLNESGDPSQSEPVDHVDPTNHKTESIQLDQDGVQVQDLVDLALERNNVIHEARKRWESAVHRARVKSGLPDPKLMSMVAVEPIQTRDGPVDWQAKLTQRFPWFGLLEAKEKRQLAKAGRTYARYRRKHNSIRKKVKQQFAEYQYLSHATGVVNDMKNYLNRMEKSVRVAYESGEVPVHDLLRLENQYEKIHNRGQDLIDQERAVRAELNHLLDRPTSAPLGEPDESPPDVVDLDEDRLRKALLKHRPGIDEAKFRQRAAREEMRFANLSYYPDFSAGITYSGVGDSDKPGTVDAGSNAYGVLFTMDLPLWQEKRRARVRSARARERSARMQYEDERSSGYAKLTGALAKLREQERRIDLYRETLIPNAERSLTSAREEYESGDMDIVSFLDFQHRLLMSRLDLYQARATRRKTVAELEMVIGIPLKRLPDDG